MPRKSSFLVKVFVRQCSNRFWLSFTIECSFFTYHNTVYTVVYIPNLCYCLLRSLTLLQLAVVLAKIRKEGLLDKAISIPSKSSFSASTRRTDTQCANCCVIMGNRLTLGKKVAAISLFIVVTKWLWRRKRLTSRKENAEVELLKQKKISEVSEEEIGKVCQRYGLALKRNMLPDDVCVKLPSPTFDPWEAIVATLPELNESGCLRERVDALELIQYEDELSTESNLRRAVSIYIMRFWGEVS